MGQSAGGGGGWGDIAVSGAPIRFRGIEFIGGAGIHRADGSAGQAR